VFKHINYCYSTLAGYRARILYCLFYVYIVCRLMQAHAESQCHFGWIWKSSLWHVQSISGHSWWTYCFWCIKYSSRNDKWLRKSRKEVYIDVYIFQILSMWIISGLRKIVKYAKILLMLLMNVMDSWASSL